MTRSAALNFQPRDALAQVGNVVCGFQFGAQVGVFEEGPHLRESRIHFVLDAANLGNDLVFQALNIRSDLAGFGIDFRLKLFVSKSILALRPLDSESILPSSCLTSLFNSRSSGAMKSCKSWRTDWTTSDIRMIPAANVPESKDD